MMNLHKPNLTRALLVGFSLMSATTAFGLGLPVKSNEIGTGTYTVLEANPALKCTMAPMTHAGGMELPAGYLIGTISCRSTESTKDTPIKFAEMRSNNAVIDDKQPSLDYDLKHDEKLMTPATNLTNYTTSADTDVYPVYANQTENFQIRLRSAATLTPGLHTLTWNVYTFVN